MTSQNLRQHYNIAKARDDDESNLVIVSRKHKNIKGWNDNKFKIVGHKKSMKRLWIEVCHCVKVAT